MNNLKKCVVKSARAFVFLMEFPMQNICHEILQISNINSLQKKLTFLNEKAMNQKLMKKVFPEFKNHTIKMRIGVIV